MVSPHLPYLSGSARVEASCDLESSKILDAEHIRGSKIRRKTPRHAFFDLQVSITSVTRGSALPASSPACDHGLKDLGHNPHS